YVVLLDERRTIGPKETASPIRKQQTNSSAGKREQRTLGEQLTQQTPAASAKCGPDSHFLLAARGLSEKKVGKVGACDQENQANGAQHHGASKNKLIVIIGPDCRFGQRCQCHAAASVVLGIFGFEPGRNGFERSFGLSHADTRLETAKSSLGQETPIVEKSSEETSEDLIPHAVRNPDL